MPLLIAGLGLLGTIGGTLGGVFLTQRRADRREAETRAEARAREEAAWERDDRLRTFEHRRQAYVDFWESLRSMTLRVYNFGMALDDGDAGAELSDGWQLSTYERLLQLQPYALPATFDAASEAYSAAWWWGHKTRHGRDDDEFYDGQERSQATEAVLLERIRRDLHVPEEDEG